MDELIRDLIERAGLTEAQAKASAQVVIEWLRHDERRKKILAASVASMVASGVV